MGGSRLFPTRSGALEDWEGVGGDGAGGTRSGYQLAPLNVVGVEVEEEGEEAEEEEVGVEGALEQAEERREARKSEVEEEDGRKASEEVGQREGEACGPCESRWRQQREVF